MKAFAVAFVSFHDNELILEKVYADSKIEAALQYLKTSEYEMPQDSYFKLSTLKNDLFDMDALIEVMEWNVTEVDNTKLPALLQAKH